jgi:hypothetical protein
VHLGTAFPTPFLFFVSGVPEAQLLETELCVHHEAGSLIMAFFWAFQCCSASEQYACDVVLRQFQPMSTEIA